MVSWNYKFCNRQGLHVRPIAKIITALFDYQCETRLSCHGKQAEIKDLMGVMALEIQQGDIVAFQFEGKDEDAASRAVRQLLSESRL